MNKLVYKMVRNSRDDQGLRVYKSYCGEHKWMVIYRLGIKAVAPIGGLFCFPSLEDCLRYIKEEFYGEIPANCSILECKTRCKLKPLSYMGSPSEDSITAFWTGTLLYVPATPDNTHTVKSLTPVRVLDITAEFDKFYNK